MISVLKKTSIFLVITFFGLTAEAQYDNSFRVSLLDLKFGLNNVHSTHDTLIFRYQDEATNPHHFLDTLRPSISSTLIGGEITAACMSFHRKLYIDGVSIGAYGGNHQTLFSVYTGVGYERTFAEKFKIIPHLIMGWSSLNFYDGAFTPSDQKNYMVSGVELNGQSTLRLYHSSWWVAPRLSFSYEFLGCLSLSLSAGYRITFTSHEKMGFSDRYKRYAYIPLDESVERNGSYSSQKIYGLSGMMFNLGVSFFIDE